MDFFERQDRARRSTKKLVVLFVLAVIAIVLSINAVAVGARYFFFQSQDDDYRTGYGQTTFDREFHWFDPALAGGITAITLFIIGGASGFKTLQIHGDGGKVARMLGGRPLDTQTTDPDERKLLNIVEEMSIASGVPVPDVYVMDHEQGINAFAAGSSVGEAALGVTRGCIEKLSRDELQGVIAHEFSHILNGDMKLNIRLIGVIFGILVIGLLGYTMFRYAPYMGSSRSSRSKDNGGAALFFLAVGGAVWLIGSIGVFFGRWIQASVSRQREYLADASAVQFTRNPAGIRDALRKIGGGVSKARVENRHAGEISHMWFGQAFSGLFATHPPLPERIKAIDPQWDGTMLKAEYADPRDEAMRLAEQRRYRSQGQSDPNDLFDAFGLGRGGAGGAMGGGLGAILGGVLAEQEARQRQGRPSRARLQTGNVTDRVGQVSPENIEFAHQFVKVIPQQLRDAAHDPTDARGIILALFLSPERSVRLMQDEAIAQKDPAASEAVERYLPILTDLGPAVRLPLINLCLPALRHLGGQMKATLLSTLGDVINADERVEPFEYALHKIVTRGLGHTQSHRVKWMAIEPVSGAVGTLLSALASAGHSDPREAERAFRHGTAKVRQGDLSFDPRFGLDTLDEALTTLGRSSAGVKRQVIDASAATVSADGTVTIEEAELLRAFAAVLDCPLPPFIERATAAPASDSRVTT